MSFKAMELEPHSLQLQSAIRGRISMHRLCESHEPNAPRPTAAYMGRALAEAGTTCQANSIYVLTPDCHLT